MSKLEDELEREKQERLLKEQQVKPPPEVKREPTPQERLVNTEAEIKAFKAAQDLESIQLGYKDLKVRESTIADRETTLVVGKEELVKRIGEFELEQKKRVETANKKADEYNEAFNLLKTERAEAKRIMEDAIRKKSEADNIIKSQTEAEKVNQEKQEAYNANMDEAIKLLVEIVKVLRRQENSKSLNLAVVLGKDLTLIQWLQYKKVGLQTLADIISAECDRIVEVCEYLQDSKTDNSAVLNYLLQSVEWLQTSLKIQWQPNNGEIVRS